LESKGADVRQRRWLYSASSAAGRAPSPAPDRREIQPSCGGCRVAPRRLSPGTGASAPALVSASWTFRRCLPCGIADAISLIDYEARSSWLADRNFTPALVDEQRHDPAFLLHVDHMRIGAPWPRPPGESLRTSSEGQRAVWWRTTEFRLRPRRRM